MLRSLRAYCSRRIFLNCVVQNLACQEVLILLRSHHANVCIQNSMTAGTKNVVVMDGKVTKAPDNLNVMNYWSHVSVLDVTDNSSQY